MRTALPDYMPIVANRMRSGDYQSVYEEREITTTTDLCDASGRLNPAAIGWSRRPLVRANLRGHWPRKKRWNFWNWISDRFVFSVTVADIDYAAFCQASFIDFETKRSVAATALALPGSLTMPEHVDRTIEFRGRTTEYVNQCDAGGTRVRYAGTGAGQEIRADFAVLTPPAHESLNIVVPWSTHRFQLNSKHNTLPCEGEVRIGDTRYRLDPANCHGVQDFGRGLWPYRSFWNWGVATGVQDGHLIGVNVGGKWTTGTGVNENGVFVDGRLYKVMEDVSWSYDPDDWMRPWRVQAPHTRMIDLTLEPVFVHRVQTGFGLLSSGGVCCFGRWSGTVSCDGEEIRVRNLIGWAEEFAHRW